MSLGIGGVPDISRRAAGRRAVFFTGLAWGALLALVPLVDFAMRPPMGDIESFSFAMAREAPPALAAALVALLAAQAVPAGWAAWRFGLDLSRSRAVLALMLAIMVVYPLGLLGQGELKPVINLILLLYTLAIAMTLASIDGDGDELMRGLLIAVAIGHAAAIAVMIADGNFRWGRLYGRSGANYWGLVALTCAFASLALRTWPQRALPLMASAAAIYLCQARGSMVAGALGAVVVWLIVVATADKRRGAWLVVGAVGAAMIVVPVLLPFAIDRLLLVSDQSRGLSSGGTGRLQVWAQSVALLVDNPWLGVGYRQHELHVTAASSAHNAYLATLADTGLVGFAAYVLFLFGGAIAAARRALARPSGVNLALVGFLTAFMTAGLFERNALNTGNAFSMMMIFAAAWSLRGRPAAPRLIGLRAD